MDLKTKPIPWHFHRYLHSPLTLSFTDRHDDISTHHTAETAWPTTECTKLLLVWLITGQVLCQLSLPRSLTGPDSFNTEPQCNSIGAIQRNLHIRSSLLISWVVPGRRTGQTGAQNRGREREAKVKGNSCRSWKSSDHHNKSDRDSASGTFFTWAALAYHWAWLLSLLMQYCTCPERVPVPTAIGLYCLLVDRCDSLAALFVIHACAHYYSRGVIVPVQGYNWATPHNHSHTITVTLLGSCGAMD